MQGLALAGTLLSAVGSIAGGISANENAKSEAKVMERRANEEAASATRTAAQRAQQARLVLSQQQARAAMGGGDTTDPTILEIKADTAARGELATEGAVYEGQVAKDSLDYQAAIKRRAGQQAMLAGFIGAGTSIFSGKNDWGKFSGGTRAPTTTYGGW